MRVTLRRVPALAALAAALLAAVPALAGGGVTLNLNGGNGNRALRACGIVHHYTLYRPARRIGFSGTVSGVSGAFTVKVKVKKCVSGRWVPRLALHTAGSAGRYRGSFGSGRRGYYFARTYYYQGTVVRKSDKQYLKVG